MASKFKEPYTDVKRRSLYKSRDFSKMPQRKFKHDIIAIIANLDKDDQQGRRTQVGFRTRSELNPTGDTASKTTGNKTTKRQSIDS